MATTKSPFIFIFITIIIIMVLFGVVFIWYLNKPIICYVPARSVCPGLLEGIYRVIDRYGNEKSFLPSNLPNENEWAKPFFENAGLGPEKSRKWLICPTDIELYEDGKVLQQKIDSLKPWYSSYRFNIELLGMKWEIIKEMKIPLLIEKSANHNNKKFILFTDGGIRETEK